MYSEKALRQSNYKKLVWRNSSEKVWRQNISKSLFNGTYSKKAWQQMFVRKLVWWFVFGEGLAAINLSRFGDTSSSGFGGKLTPRRIGCKYSLRRTGGILCREGMAAKIVIIQVRLLAASHLWRPRSVVQACLVAAHRLGSLLAEKSAVQAL